ncbi:MAG: hypothetical protein L3J43_06235 [Sulfurovum sp.]|nr:hypothetical protein [Sulfurovum sp.]
MKIKNLSQLLLSLLFLFAYQINTVHSNQHFIEELECHLCDVSKQLEANTHETNVPVFVELNTLQTHRTAQRLSFKRPLDLTQQPQMLPVDFSELHTFLVPPIPLGYFSHAPPHIFS